MAKSIALIRFSSRDLGNCAAISKYLQKYFKNDDVRTYTADDRTFAPCNHCDYECLKPGSVCPHRTQDLVEIMDCICNADMTFFIIPNYCGVPSANYYAFNERSVGYFNGDRDLMNRYMSSQKAFIFVSNSESSAFSDIVNHQATGEVKVLYLKSSKYSKRSIAGDMLESDAAKSDLQSFLESISI